VDECKPLPTTSSCSRARRALSTSVLNAVSNFLYALLARMFSLFSSPPRLFSAFLVVAASIEIQRNV
jgi:hypothetical protein